MLSCTLRYGLTIVKRSRAPQTFDSDAFGPATIIFGKKNVCDHYFMTIIYGKKNVCDKNSLPLSLSPSRFHSLARSLALSLALSRALALSLSSASSPARAGCLSLAFGFRNQNDTQKIVDQSVVYKISSTNFHVGFQDFIFWTSSFLLNGTADVLAKIEARHIHAYSLARPASFIFPPLSKHLVDYGKLGAIKKEISTAFDVSRPTAQESREQIDQDVDIQVQDVLEELVQALELLEEEKQQAAVTVTPNPVTRKSSTKRTIS